jgi:hypothetical protein
VDPLARLALELARRDVRYVVIGVAGANYWALGGATIFTTLDRDLFLPLDVDNLLRCWDACEETGLDLLSGLDPLDRPRDRWLAQRVVESRAAVRATNRTDLDIDLTLVMAGFDFDLVWNERRHFVVDDVGIPVARLIHIVESKRAAGREKDSLFLATHRQALEELLGTDRDDPAE